MKVFFKNLKTFVRKNLISCACFLLTILVAITGSVSYSKYVSTSPVNKNPTVGGFSATAKINGVSALSFTNTAFWGGTVNEDDKIAMNALRSIDFAVNNFETDALGNDKVAEVRMKYALVFSAPVNFSERLAIQVFDGSDNPITPQIVIHDLFTSASNEEKVYKTSVSEDYNSTPFTDLEFATSLTTDGDKITYCSAYNDKENILIQLERFSKEVHQQLLFRTWDCTALTSVINPEMNTEGGKLTAPLEVIYSETVDFYRISVSLPQFVLPAGVKTTVNHSIQLAPTNTIEDLHLGGSFIDDPETQKHLTSIYGRYDKDGNPVGDQNKLWTLQTIHEAYKDIYVHNLNGSLVEDKDTNTNYIGTNTWEQNVMGSVTVYNEGDTVTGDPIESSYSISGGADVVSAPYDERTISADSDIQWGEDTTEAPTHAWDGEYTTSNGGNRRTFTRTGIQYGTKTTVKEYKVKTLRPLETKYTETKQETVHTESVVENTITQNITITTTTEATTYYDADADNSYVTTYTKTTTEIYEREVSCTYTFQRNGYSWSGPTKGTVTGTSDAEKTDTNSVETQTKVPITNSEDLTKTSTTTKTDNIRRTIVRSLNTTTIKLDSVKWTKYNNDNTVDTFTYTETSPLEMFMNETGEDIDDSIVTKLVQQIYIAQCYSKNYPFYVNVVFEQILE